MGVTSRTTQQDPQELFSCQDPRNYLTVHVCKPHVAAAETVGQALVVHTQQMQDRRVQVMDLDLVFDGVITVLRE